MYIFAFWVVQGYVTQVYIAYIGLEYFLSFNFFNRLEKRLLTLKKSFQVNFIQVI